MKLKLDRKLERAESNNSDDPNKNSCTLAICQALSVDHKVKYLHNIDDMLLAIRTAYAAVGRLSRVRGKTVGAIRRELKHLGALYYLVGVDGHVLLLGHKGQTLVDIDPMKPDRRKIHELYGIFLRTGSSFRVR